MTSSSVISGNNGRADAGAVPFGIRQGNLREALAVIFLRMGRTEVQAGADAHRLQLFHQRVAADAARGLIDADDKQMPGVLVIPGRDAQRFKRRVRQLAQVALGNLGPALIGVAQFFQLDQRQSGVDIGKVVLEARGDHLRLWRAAVGLAIISVHAQTMEFQATDAGGQLVVVGDNQPPSAQVMFLIAWNEKMAVPCQPTWRPL